MEKKIGIFTAFVLILIVFLFLSYPVKASWIDDILSPFQFLFEAIFPSSPEILEAKIEPIKVEPSDYMIITAKIKDKYGIENVKANMAGIELINLTLISGDNKEGIYQASWFVHSVEIGKTYNATIIAKNVKGKESFFVLQFHDDPVFCCRRQINGSGPSGLIRITLDTASLISQGKMRTDCGDIRFTDSKAFDSAFWTRNFSYNLQGCWLQNWNYRKPITISNTGSALTDYQVLINLDTATLVFQGKMRSDCGDIRFTDSDGSTLLNYWLESGCNSASTKLWVKVPNIPANSNKTIYIYYGNPSATSTSNGAAVFLWFDDFSTNTLNNYVVWNWRSNVAGSASITSGYLSMGANNLIIPKNLNVIDASARANVWNDCSATTRRVSIGIREQFNTSGEGTTTYSYHWQATMYGDSYLTNGLYLGIYLNDGSLGTDTSTIPPCQTFVNMEIAVVGTTIKAFYQGSQKFSVTATNYASGNVTLICGYSNCRFDNLIVRKYTSPEPTISIGNEETGTIFYVEVPSGVTSFYAYYGNPSVTSISNSSISGWQYRRPITINNTLNSNNLTDYQVLVTINTQNLISQNKMRDDCGDIRFTDSDGSALLNYWLEYGCNSTDTKIWVKVPYIPASSTKTIYVYYGNSYATSASNGNNTFVLFQSFDNQSTPPDWSEVTKTFGGCGGYCGQPTAVRPVPNNTNNIYGSLSYIAGFDTYSPLLTAQGRSDGSSYVYSLAQEMLNYSSQIPTGNYIVKFKVKLVENLNCPYQTAVRSGIIINDTLYRIHLSNCASYPNWYEEGMSGATYPYSSQIQLDQITTPNVWYNESFNLINSAINKLTILVQTGTAVQGATTTSRGKFNYDVLYIRKYTSPEPTISIGSEELTATMGPEETWIRISGMLITGGGGNLKIK
ncbi:MAG: DUF2341 domain-containing protein [Candidatus Aenigmatarchaeota archaeon]